MKGQVLKKVLMIATGGTIASKRTSSGLTPLISSKEILEYVPNVGEFCEVDTIQILNIDSTDIHPKHWSLIAHTIEQNYDKYDGFVICHGTDTMSYTAAAISYLIQRSPKPIVITGAQKPIDMEITDAKTNLFDSFIYASSDRACGVVIVFNGKVIAGTRAKKVRTKSFDAFASINYPFIAIIQDGRIIEYIPQEKSKFAVFYHNLSTKVGLLKLIPGIDSGVLAYMLDKYDAIILESYGVGGIPNGENYGFQEEMKKWTGKNKTIVMTTQVPNEGSNMSIYKVGNVIKEECNMLESYDMTLEACVTKMMWILGMTNEEQKIQEMFYKTIGSDILYK